MNLVTPLLRSLLLSTAFSFLVPVSILGSVLMGLSVIHHLPKLEGISSAGITQLNTFLGAFGSGSAWQGLIVIGLVFSLVGTLFDAFAFYWHHQFRELD